MIPEYHSFEEKHEEILGKIKITTKWQVDQMLKQLEGFYRAREHNQFIYRAVSEAKYKMYTSLQLKWMNKIDTNAYRKELNGIQREIENNNINKYDLFSIRKKKQLPIPAVTFENNPFDSFKECSISQFEITNNDNNDINNFFCLYFINSQWMIEIFANNPMAISENNYPLLLLKNKEKDWGKKKETVYMINLTANKSIHELLNSTNEWKGKKFFGCYNIHKKLAPYIQQKLINYLQKDNETHSFNYPGDMRIDLQRMDLGYIIRKLQNKEIDVNNLTRYPTKVWNEIEQSQFIESILLQIPLPAFYFQKDYNSSKWRVVDGKQRIRALQNFFINQSLELQGLDYTSPFEGLSFKHIDNQNMRLIGSADANIYLIDGNENQEAVQSLYKRINKS
ncbi:MAG: DUF262 domain-containing protein [Carboxylicivirga sp.]|jgi:hypothetical protein|nr:DUF262 domain-containing protein [Carboxylicivirga sp.]